MRKGWTTVRMTAWNRDGGHCIRCGRVLPDDDFEGHHRRLRSRGGQDVLPNVITLCHLCHGWAHLNPSTAELQGLIVPSWTHEAIVAVWRLDPWTGQHGWALPDLDWTPAEPLDWQRAS